VLNQAVTLGPCAIAHGNLAITISTTPVISQPGAFSQGQTVPCNSTLMGWARG
jgi:flagellar P-ring protein precursor FlgI